MRDAVLRPAAGLDHRIAVQPGVAGLPERPGLLGTQGQENLPALLQHPPDLGQDGPEPRGIGVRNDVKGKHTVESPVRVGKPLHIGGFDIDIQSFPAGPVPQMGGSLLRQVERRHPKPLPGEVDGVAAEAAA